VGHFQTWGWTVLVRHELLEIETDGDRAHHARAGLERAPTRASARLRLVCFVGCAGISAFVVVVGAFHVLNGGLNPAEHTVSEYALGRYGWLMQAAFAALGLGALATALGLRLRFEISSRRRVGLLALVTAAVGLFLDAGFNTDHLRVPETFDGTMHGEGMLIICLTLPAAACILGSDFVRSTNAAAARWLLAVGPAQLIAIFSFEVSPIAYRGLTERIAIVLGVAILGLLQSLVASGAGTGPVNASVEGRASQVQERAMGRSK